MGPESTWIRSLKSLRAWKKAPSTHMAFRTNEKVKCFPASWTDDILGYSELLKIAFCERTSWSPWRSWGEFNLRAWLLCRLQPCRHLWASQMAGSGRELRVTYTVLSVLELLHGRSSPVAVRRPGECRSQLPNMWDRPAVCVCVCNSKEKGICPRSHQSQCQS